MNAKIKRDIDPVNNDGITLIPQAMSIAVSYTHLDVYKRQASILQHSSRAFMPIFVV